MAILLADDEPPTAAAAAGCQDARPDVLQYRCDGPGALVVGEEFVRQVHISGFGDGVVEFCAGSGGDVVGLVVL